MSASVRDALTAYEAAKARQELITHKRQEQEQDARFRALAEGLALAKVRLGLVAGQHTAGEATAAELDAAREEYAQAETRDRLHQIECEGVLAAEAVAEAKVAEARHALDLAVSLVAVEANRDREAKAKQAALVLRGHLLHHRALARLANAATFPNDAIPMAFTETRFQAALRALVFDPASPDEQLSYSVRDFLD